MTPISCASIALEWGSIPTDTFGRHTSSIMREPHKAKVWKWGKNMFWAHPWCSSHGQLQSISPSSLIVYTKLLDTSLEAASQTSVSWLPLLQLSFGGVCGFKCKPDMDGIPLGAWSSASALGCLGDTVLVISPHHHPSFQPAGFHLHITKASFSLG